MTEHTISGGNFTPGTQEGDPGKLKYLHTPDWKGKAFVGGKELRIDERACPGCAFPGAPEGKWPHVEDSRCSQWNARQREWRAPAAGGVNKKKEVTIDDQLLQAAVCQGSAL